MIYLYRFLQILLAPLIVVYVLIRLITGKEDLKRFSERRGFPSLDRDSSKKLIWIHCASVGESISVLPIIKRLARTKNTNVLVTTGTVTSARLMAEKLPKNTFHQFVPIDYTFAVKRFVKHWNPDISVFVESDLWPNLLAYAPNKVLINARMSDRSFKRYSKAKCLAGMLLNKFDTIYAQSKQDYDRFTSLTTAQVVNSGNIKYDGPAPEYKSNEFNVLAQAFDGRKILAVASTHKGEDEISIDIYKQLQKQHKDLLMLLIPRHPHRGDDIAKLLAESNLDHVQRSKTKGLEQASSMNVYLADTLGEVGLWYALADVVLMGGTFTWAGHNPLEPLKAGKPTYSGPNMQNFRDMSDVLTKKGVLVICEDEQEVTNHLNNALSDKEFLSSFVEKSQTAIESMTGATDIVITALRAKIKG